MYYKKPRPVPQKNEYIDVFRGYNAQTRIRDGEFEDMENLTSDCFPVMAPRKPRQLYAQGTKPNALAMKGYGRHPLEPDFQSMQLAYVDGKTLHVFGSTYDLGLSDGEKQIVCMGDKIIVFPDGAYISISKNQPKTEHINVEFRADSARFEMCDINGAAYTIRFTQATTPEAPADGDYWINTSGEKHTLSRYSKALGVWAGVGTVYVKISATGIGKAFRDQDGIKLSTQSTDQQMKDLNGYNIIWGKTDDSIIVVGILDKVTTTNVVVSRQAPEMDYVFECNNRLWGYRYAKEIDGMVNRIYASAWGDPTNWHRFSGRADDSYFADVGSDGVFTGGCAFRGHPYFFKENSIIAMYGVNPPFSMQPTQASGVQEGCSRSIAVANERMYYKSRQGVCVFTGAVPTDIGAPLGEKQYENAVGEVYSGKYYLSMQDGEAHHLFVYDEEKRMWHREDSLWAVDMARGVLHLYAIDGDTGAIITLEGQEDEKLDYIEDQVEWSAVTGDIGLSDPRQKYISKVLVRMELDQGAQVNIDVRYDRRKEWIPVGVQRSTRLQTFNMPIRPERCDHLQLRFSGYGPFKIYSITKTIQQGSDRT